MRKITAIVILSLLPSLTIPAQETKEISKSSNSSSTEEYTKFRFGGYGEMVANFKDYGINRFYGGNDGNPKKNRNTISIPRFVLALIISSIPNGYSVQRLSSNLVEQVQLSN